MRGRKLFARINNNHGYALQLALREGTKTIDHVMPWFAAFLELQLALREGTKTKIGSKVTLFLYVAISAP